VNPVRRVRSRLTSLASLTTAVLLTAAAAIAAGPHAAGASQAPVACVAQQVFPQDTQPIVGSTAVLFVHGFVSSPGIWSQGSDIPLPAQAALLPGLTAWTFDYSKVAANWVTDPNTAPKLAGVIGCLAQATGNPVVVVGHSMGGLATQLAVSLAGPDGTPVARQVAEVITLGTPYQGSLFQTYSERGANALEGVAIGSGGLGGAGLVAAFEEMRSACAGAIVRNPDVDPCADMGLGRTPAGEALMYESDQIKALPPWPRGLPVYPLVADIHENVGVGALSVSVSLGDIPVSVESGTAAAYGKTPFIAQCQNNILLSLMWDSDSEPCYHHNLPHNPQIVAAVIAELRKFSKPPRPSPTASPSPTPSSASGPFIGVSETEGVYAADPATGRVLWTYQHSEGELAYTLNPSRPVFAGDTVYFGDIGDTTVYALDARTGALRWNADSLQPGVGQSPVTVSDATVYFWQKDGSATALDAATGKVRWTIPIGHVDNDPGPVVAGGIVLAPGREGNTGVLYGLDAKTGKTMWSQKAGAAAGSGLNPGGLGFVNLVVARDVVYATGTAGALTAYDIATGAVRWTVSATDVPDQSPPVTDGANVYVGGEDGALLAYNAADGAPGWRYLTDGPVSSGQGTATRAADVAAANGVVYLDNGDGTVRALDAATGAVRFNVPSVDGASSPAFTPQVVAGTLYVSGQTGIVAMDAATGALRWRQPAGTGQSTVTVRAGIVFDTDENGHVYAVDAATGSVLWDHANQAAGG